MFKQLQLIDFSLGAVIDVAVALEAVVADIHAWRAIGRHDLLPRGVVTPPHAELVLWCTHSHSRQAWGKALRD